MPAIKQYTAPDDQLRPTETGIDAVARAASRAGGFFDAAAAATERVGRQNAAAVEQVGQQHARAVQQIGEKNAQMVGEVGRQEADIASSSIKTVGKVALDYMDHQQVSHGAAAFAAFTEQATKQWDQTLKGYTDADGTVHPPADPNDPTVGQRFMASLEPQLAQFKDSFTTENSRKWAESHIEQLRAHFGTKVTADTATLAADAVSVNYKTTVNSLSNTAMMSPDAVPSLINQVRQGVDAIISSSPALTGDKAGEVRGSVTQAAVEQIVKAGAIGAIQKAADPEAEAEKWGKKYPEYINGPMLKQLGTEAKRQARADRTAEKWDKQLENEERKRVSDQTEVGYLQRLYSDDPKVQAQVNPKAIVNDPSLTRESKERMVNIVNREFKPETDAKISAATSVQIMRKIGDPNSDPREISQMIFEARTKDPGEQGSLNKSDFADLQKQLIDRKTPEGAALTQDRNEFFKKFAPTIDPSMGDASSLQFGHHTALGLQKMYLAEKDARRAEDALRKAGKDPHSLYDPSSPDFFGRPGNIMKYRASMQDATNYQASLGKNLTGPGTTVTGVSVEDAPLFKPPADWQFSPSRQQYRDPAGKVYDISGKPVK